MATHNSLPLSMIAPTTGGPSDGGTPSASLPSDTSLPTGHHAFPTISATAHARDKHVLYADGSSESASPPEKRRKLDKGKGKSVEYGRSLGAGTGELLSDDGRPREDDQGKGAGIQAKERTNAKHKPKKQKPQRRQVLRAKEAKWKDIPEWGDRTDCPLFRLPAEILDLCFGTKLDHGLQLRDYLALAGVSKYFRIHMTNLVWREILRAARPTHYGKPTKYGTLLFTRPVENWQVQPSPLFSSDNFDDFYGCKRETWTEAQYIHFERRARVLQIARAVAADRREEMRASTRRNFKIKVDGVCRTVLATVKGLPNNGTPEARDENGLPPGGLRLEDLISERLAKRDQVVPPPKTWFQTWDDDPEPPVDIWDPVTGEQLPHDYYPSHWRKQAVEYVNEKYISKTDAIKVFKVGEAELLCLKHHLVPNPMNPKFPQYTYLLAAVQALALRSHGGPIGHHYHVKFANEKAEKAMITRRVNKPAPPSPALEVLLKERSVASTSSSSDAGPSGTSVQAAPAPVMVSAPVSAPTSTPAPAIVPVGPTAQAAPADSPATLATAVPPPTLSASQHQPTTTASTVTTPGVPPVPAHTAPIARLYSFPLDYADAAAHALARPLTLNEKKSCYTSSKVDDLGAKFGVDRDSGLWYWRGAFDDFVMEHRAARPPPENVQQGGERRGEGGGGGEEQGVSGVAS